VPRAVLGLGGNLGARRALLDCARTLLAAQPGLVVCAASSLYHTPPLGPPQPDYLNAALSVEWVGSARALLAITQHIETLLGRERAQRWGPRTLDIDILHWSDGPVREPGLCVPHPELLRRPFALVPLLEVAPELAASLGLAPGAADPGFAPREPFSPPFQREPDGSLRLAPEQEPLELAARFVAALALRLGPAQAPGDARADPPASTLPFACPLPAAAPGDQLEALLARLGERVHSAARHGFVARKAAPMRIGAGRCEGVFVGARTDGPVAGAVPRWTLEPGVRGYELRFSRA
jgi:2-amino-4-hydroxy-6-hydroxymethyldihydropteridine diphosphokinase